MSKKASKHIYKITILNWEKYNGSKKKGHSCILLSTGFLSDAKIRTLPIGGRLLYLGLLLRCGELTSSSIEASYDQLVSFAGGSGQLVDSLMQQLEYLQLVTSEKIHSFNNRIEKKSKEKKSKEVLASPPADPAPAEVLTSVEIISKPVKASKDDRELNRKVWESYSNAYQRRHKVEPTRNATVNAQISAFRKRIGEDAAEVIAFYLTSNQTFYLQKMHSVGAALHDAESLHTQWKKGHAISTGDLRNFEKTSSHQALIDDIERNGI